MQNKFMQLALAQAHNAAALGEVPVGAVIVRGGEVIASAHNLCETEKNPILHAEIAVIFEALRVLDAKRLDDCDLYVTLEPCLMCCGAIANARIRRLYFGAFDKLGGCVVSNMHCFDSPSPFAKTEYYCGIMEEDCSALLSDFFKNIRP